MKKLLLCVLVATLTTLSSQAQEFHFGAKAGLNFTSARGDDAKDLEIRTSFNFGGVLRIPFNEKLAFQARYVTGFNNTFLDTDGELYQTRNSVISISVGCFFN